MIASRAAAAAAAEMGRTENFNFHLNSGPLAKKKEKLFFFLLNVRRSEHELSSARLASLSSRVEAAKNSLAAEGETLVGSQINCSNCFLPAANNTLAARPNGTLASSLSLAGNYLPPGERAASRRQL